MRDDVQKLLAFLAVTFALVAAAVVLLPRFLSFAAGPEGELITELKRAERTGLELPVAGGTLRGTQVQYQRLSVVVDPAGDRATVTGTLDFTGTFGATQVSSLGLERVAFAHHVGGWQPVDGFAPRLQAIVLALEHRRAGLESGALLVTSTDAGLAPDLARLRSMTHRVYTARAWYIRSEREEVTVSEDYRLQGQRPDRPVDEVGTTRLSLQPASGGQFFFPNGLM